MTEVVVLLSFFAYLLRLKNIIALDTDSAGGVSKGCGIYFDGKWACLN
jgi:hypothetical protein